MIYTKTISITATALLFLLSGCGDKQETVLGDFESKLGTGGIVDASGTDNRFGTSVGVRDESAKTLVSDGRPGFLQYGPYINLPKGKYEVRWYGTLFSVGKTGIGKVDIYFSNDNKIAATQEVLVTPSEKENVLLSTVKFETPEETQKVEYRFYVNDGTKVVLKHIVLEKK